MAVWWCVDITVRLALLLCLVILVHFLPPNGLRISGGNFATHELPKERIDQLRSAYLPLMQHLLSVDRYDEWMALVNMLEEERFEICRMPQDLQHTNIFAAVRKRAKMHGVGKAVMRQMATDFATLSSLMACTDEDYTFIEKMDLPMMLISSQQWMHVEEAFSAHIARAWSALIMSPAKTCFRAPHIDQCGILQNATTWETARVFGTGATGVNIDLTSDPGGRWSELMGKGKVRSRRTTIEFGILSKLVGYHLCSSRWMDF